MSGDDSERRHDLGRRGDYRVARIVVAGFLTGGVIVLVVGDVLEHVDGYRADPIVLGILIGGILALLGLTVSDRLIHG